jgi:putative oxidoreductase
MKSEMFEALGKLVLRLAVGGLMLCHGVYKLLHGLAGIEKMLAAKGLPTALAYGVPLGEVVAPLLIIIGFWSRLAGLTLAFTMAMAVYLAFGAAALNFNSTGGVSAELSLLFLAGGLAILCLGSGKFSVSGGNGAWD